MDTNSNRETPLHYAVYGHHASVASRLLELVGIALKEVEDIHGNDTHTHAHLFLFISLFFFLDTFSFVILCVCVSVCPCVRVYVYVSVCVSVGVTAVDVAYSTQQKSLTLTWPRAPLVSTRLKR